MRVLSGRQPWWWAILYAGKGIENRRMVVRGEVRPPTWWKYRGPILLHASAGCTLAEWTQGYEWIRSAFGFEFALNMRMPDLSGMLRGGIVGRARIVDVVRPHPGQPCRHLIDRGYSAIDMRWHMPEQFGFVLADVERLPFFPCKGALGLFTPTPAMLAHVAAHDATPLASAGAP